MRDPGREPALIYASCPTPFRVTTPLLTSYHRATTYPPKRLMHAPPVTPPGYYGFSSHVAAGSSSEYRPAVAY
eukprot:704836-Hanusia_phi.AAC.3